MDKRIEITKHWLGVLWGHAESQRWPGGLDHVFRALVMVYHSRCLRMRRARKNRLNVAVNRG